MEVLRGITLVIGQGDFVSIVGPSGGGKSTLLNMIGLLDTPSSGEYLVGDVVTGTASNRSLAELRSDRFAFIFQSFHLLDRRPVTDSVELGLYYRGVPTAQRRERALDALRQVGLAELAYQLPSRLSGGERQRVAIARALASGAPIVVADEPTGNLDSVSSNAVVDSLHALHRSGCTIILVTHSPDVASAADYQLRIRDGLLMTESNGDSIRVERPQRGEPRQAPGRPSTVRFRDLLADSAASLRSRMARSSGLVAAVAVGVGLAITTVGISSSGSAQVSETFDVHVNRDVSAEWTPADLATLSTNEVATIPERLAELNGVRYAGVLANHDGHVAQSTSVRTAIQVPVFTASGHLLEAARATIDWAPGHAHKLGRGEAIAGGNLVKQITLGPLVGSPVVAIDGRDITIVGVLTSSPRVPELLGAFVGPRDDSAFFGDPTAVTALVLTQAGAAQQVARQVPSVINPYQPELLTVSAPSDPTSLRSAIESDVSTTLYAFTGVALLAAIAALANAMILSVIERKQEFGLRRALGARPKHISGLVILESTIVGLVGGIVGLAGGLIGVLAITISRHWSPVLDLSLGPVAVLGGVLVGALGGVIASVRASHIQPHEALRL